MDMKQKRKEFWERVFWNGRVRARYRLFYILTPIKQKMSYKAIFRALHNFITL